ncbi:MAG: hypothetical protein M0Q92_00305 [Methanoregula sp.]|jgi:hypothetical protein|nr:hypothetical protein [Methanoregula sp.]
MAASRGNPVTILPVTCMKITIITFVFLTFAFSSVFWYLISQTPLMKDNVTMLTIYAVGAMWGPSFATDPVCTGTVTGKIEKNQLTGTWKTNGCEPEDGSTDGKFFLTMAADNQSWTGRRI